VDDNFKLKLILNENFSQIPNISFIKLEDVFNDIKTAFETDDPYIILKSCENEFDFIREVLL